MEHLRDSINDVQIILDKPEFANTMNPQTGHDQVSVQKALIRGSNAAAAIYPSQDDAVRTACSNTNKRQRLLPNRSVTTIMGVEYHYIHDRHNDTLEPPRNPR